MKRTLELRGVMVDYRSSRCSGVACPIKLFMQILANHDHQRMFFPYGRTPFATRPHGAVRVGLRQSQRDDNENIHQGIFQKINTVGAQRHRANHFGHGNSTAKYARFNTATIRTTRRKSSSLFVITLSPLSPRL